MKEIDFRIIITAIVCLCLLEGWAIYNGINGTMYTIIIAVIAGLAGYVIPSPVNLKGGK